MSALGHKRTFAVQKVMSADISGYDHRSLRDSGGILPGQPGTKIRTEALGARSAYA